MSKFETEQKLELIRAIRMQNQYDRQTLHRRENILYTGDKGRSELYSLEDTASLNGKYKDKTLNLTDERTFSETGNVISGAKIRLAIAMVLFLAFVYCDVKEIKLAGKSSKELLYILQEDSLHTVTEYLKNTVSVPSLEMRK